MLTLVSYTPHQAKEMSATAVTECVSSVSVCVLTVVGPGEDDAALDSAVALVVHLQTLQSGALLLVLVHAQAGQAKQHKVF